MLEEREKSKLSAIQTTDSMSEDKQKIAQGQTQKPEIQKSKDILSKEDESSNDTDDDNDSNEVYNALPEKSKERYEKQFNIFEEWRKRNNLTDYSETVLLQYFSEKANVSKSSSLWASYSMLRATMGLKVGVNIRKYKRLSDLLKKKAAGFKSIKSKIFTREEVNRFLTEAPDESYLMIKVLLF